MHMFTLNMSHGSSDEIVSVNASHYCSTAPEGAPETWAIKRVWLHNIHLTYDFDVVFRCHILHLTHALWLYIIIISSTKVMT